MELDDSGNVQVLDPNSGDVLANPGPIGDGRSRRYAYMGGSCYISLTYNERGTFSTTQTLYDARTYRVVSPPLPEYRFVAWSPDARYAVIASRRYPVAYYLWQPANDTLTTLRADIENYTIGSVYWDYERSQILASERWRGGFLVRAFDINSGQMRVYFEGTSIYNLNNQRNGLAAVQIKGDWLEIRGPIVTVYHHLSTYDSFAIRTNEGSSGVLKVGPEGRFVIGVRRHVIDVWDIAALPRDIGERTATHVIDPPFDYTDAIFLDATTLQITTEDGTVTLWDLSTGMQIIP